MNTVTSLGLLRDFADAYADFTRAKLPEEEQGAAVRLARAATILVNVDAYPNLKHFCTAESLLSPEAEMFDGDRPFAERLRVNAAVRFARQVAFLPPTEKA